MEELYGDVYYNNILAGHIRKNDNDGTRFTYNEQYLKSGQPAIAHVLPLQKESHYYHNGLHPYFDNLVSEGWLKDYQESILGERKISRLELLIAFGFDCIGSVSVKNPNQSNTVTHKKSIVYEIENAIKKEITNTRASISGVQAKTSTILENNIFKATTSHQLGSHIAKFASQVHPSIIENEYLTTQALKKLLPKDSVVDLQIGKVQDINLPALLVKRFDRIFDDTEVKTLHFEEFNQVLNKISDNKYNGSYKNMADFLDNNKMPLLKIKLFERIIAGILLGNTDMHLKNFALYHTKNGFTLTPSYDQVCGVLYSYKDSALNIHNIKLPFVELRPQHIIKLGWEFGLNDGTIKMACDALGKNIESAKQAIRDTEINTYIFKKTPYENNIKEFEPLKNKIIEVMEKRWNGTFNLIGQKLSKKQ